MAMNSANTQLQQADMSRYTPQAGNMLNNWMVPQQPTNNFQPNNQQQASPWNYTSNWESFMKPGWQNSQRGIAETQMNIWRDMLEGARGRQDEAKGYMEQQRAAQRYGMGNLRRGGQGSLWEFMQPGIQNYAQSWGQQANQVANYFEQPPDLSGFLPMQQNFQTTIPNPVQRVGGNAPTWGQGQNNNYQQFMQNAQQYGQSQNPYVQQFNPQTTQWLGQQWQNSGWSPQEINSGMQQLQQWLSQL